MAYNLIPFSVFKVDIIIDNYYLLIRYLKLELFLKKLISWLKSLKKLNTIPLPL